ncbi:uncharacterized protein LOC142950130 [Anarhichas minor]|uniref:uncharacterized protein LOC142950130 n=1 Tax=Anarhichas minor TaxID=65739 RepID=UPI003F7342F3
MITDLRESDSAEYKFRFTTNQPDEKYTGSPGVTLSVTGLQLEVSRPDSTWSKLKCLSSCVLPEHHSYFWYKNEQIIRKTAYSSYSVDYGDADSYSCAVSGYEDQRSPSVYAPKLPSVSVSPSAEIVEGSSVTLTCSSDANPAANYTWYKEDVNPDPPPLSGEPQLVFSSIQSSDSGQYYCRAENLLGTNRSEFISIDVKFSPVSLTAVAVGSTTAIFLAIIILAAFLLIRRKRSSTQTSQSGDGPDNSAQSSPAEQQEELCYASVSFSRNQEDLLYSNIRPARPHRRKEEEEDVEYTRVNFKSASAANESRCQEAVGDLSALYSTVSQQPRA